MALVNRTLLLADIGGTNARFALAGPEGIGRSVSLAVADYAEPEAAIRAFLDQAKRHGETTPALRRAALAVAGPVSAGTATLTNGTWRFDAAALEDAFGLERLTLVNDFEAIAWALPRLREMDLLSLGGGKGEAGAPKAVIGPGTGLGMAAFLPATDRAQERVLVSEGGHVTMAADSEREDRIVEELRRRFGHVSAERVLSGDGLVNLYEASAAVDRLPAPSRQPADIVQHAERGDCLASRAALETFCALLGAFAGDAALTLGARGGVYLAGGILPRLPERLAASEFRERFETKGRFRGYLEAIPTWLIQRPDPAFLGLWHLARRE
ncbi:MAG: glucokinase [Kiloniellales bacterium]